MFPLIISEYHDESPLLNIVDVDKNNEIEF